MPAGELAQALFGFGAQAVLGVFGEVGDLGVELIVPAAGALAELFSRHGFTAKARHELGLREQVALHGVEHLGARGASGEGKALVERVQAEIVSVRLAASRRAGAVVAVAAKVI